MQQTIRLDTSISSTFDASIQQLGWDDRSAPMLVLQGETGNNPAATWLHARHTPIKHL